MNALTQQEIIPKITDIFSKQPIDKAWLFGSFSRGEETPDSDIDLLVRFDDTAGVTLLTYARIYRMLRDTLNREVDLVQEGTLKPFAAETADKDKVLIYERKN